MLKIDRILQLLETRIARGDYALTLFPTEHGLAAEMGVGRMTARRAILRLVEKGLLYRDDSGRMSVTTQRSANRPLQIGFVTATLSSATLRWQTAAQESVRASGGYMRGVTYFHWDDPTLLEAIESFDGVFLIPPAEALPAQLREPLLNSRACIVVLGADYSQWGLHSVDLYPPESVNALLEHLTNLGHRQISALNTQPVVTEIEARLSQWKDGISAGRYKGELINEPELSYGDPMARAYQVAKEKFTKGVGLDWGAVFCTTLPAALGVMRAANEHGLTIGSDLSVCTVDDEGLGAFLIPALTSIQTSDSQPILRQCLAWMGGGQWVGPLLKRPATVEISKGGSTGPAPRKLQANRRPKSDAA